MSSMSSFWSSSSSFSSSSSCEANIHSQCRCHTDLRREKTHLFTAASEFNVVATVLGFIQLYRFCQHHQNMFTSEDIAQPTTWQFSSSFQCANLIRQILVDYIRLNLWFRELMLRISQDFHTLLSWNPRRLIKTTSPTVIRTLRPIYSQVNCTSAIAPR